MNRKIVKEIMLDTLKGEYFHDEKNNCYYNEVYMDYNDYLEESTIKDILDAENSRDYFYDYISDAYMEYISDLESEALNKVIDAISEEYSNDCDELNEDYDYSIYNFEDDEEELRELLYDYFYVKIPYEHYLNQSVNADLIIDAGDGNYDFTLNNCWNDEYEVHEESSIFWLAKTQGYNREQLLRALNEESYEKNKFLTSIYEEVLNCTSSMNALTFFIKSTIGEMIDFKEGLDNNGSITIDKNTNCGLVDFWCGAGGLLGIELEKNVDIPVKIIDSFTIDGGRGTYGVDEIYGASDSLWNGYCTINEKINKAV